jgi:heme oxygenase (biliverdin-IX-beta and delta-forming)
MGGSAIHSRLRTETAPLHRSLEARLGLLDPGLHHDRYRAVLRTFYGYWAAIEPALVPLATVAVPAFPLRARTPLLERDLVALGCGRAELAELERCADLPRLTHVEDLAGCLYVLEGARLGGQVLARTLGARLGLTPARGCAFFAGDGEATLPRWRSVLDWLEALVSAGASSDGIVASACETFRTLARWAARP